MKWKHAFRHVDVSESLIAYAEDRFGKVGRLLLKDSNWQIFYSMGKLDCQVEVVVTNPDSRFKATASCDDFYVAVDMAARKLGKQFSRRKEVLQKHKDYERSKEGRLESFQEAYESFEEPTKKSA